MTKRQILPIQPKETKNGQNSIGHLPNASADRNAITSVFRRSAIIANMTFPDQELELLDVAFADLRAFGMELQADPGWLPMLLVGLLNAALREYQHLRLGLKNSTAIVAWACRNLLELHIYTRYALASEANAQRLVAEHLADGIEIFDAFQTWLARNDATLVPPSVGEALRRLTEQQSESDFAERPPLKLKRISAEAGLADEYANMTRLAAKLSHPSAYSVLAGAEDAEIAALRPILFRAGAGHGLEIFRAIKESR